MYTSPFEYYCNLTARDQIGHSVAYLYIRSAREILAKILLQDEVDMTKLRNLANDVLSELKDMSEYMLQSFSDKDNATTIFGVSINRADVIYADLEAVMNIRILFDIITNGSILTTIRNNRVARIPRRTQTTLKDIMKAASNEIDNIIRDNCYYDLGRISLSDMKSFCKVVCGNVSVFTTSAGEDLYPDNYRKISDTWRNTLESL
jgi:hypothetical protein